LQFSRVQAPRPLLLAGVAFSLMAVVPLLEGAPFSPLRLVMTAALGAAGAILLVRGSRRCEVLVLDLEAQAFSRGPARSSLAFARGLQLTGVSEQLDDLLSNDYRVDLVFADGRHEPLLERNDPAGALRDLHEILRVWPVNVERGWGLPKHAAPWLPVPETPELPPPAASQTQKQAQTQFSGALRNSQFGAAISVAAGVVLVGSVSGLVLMGRVQRGAPTEPLSLILLGVCLTFLIALAAALAGARLRVRIARSIVIEKHIFGWVRRRIELPRRQVSAVYAVAPGSGPATHLLLQTSQGPLAFRSSTELAESVVRTLEPHATDT
jgi:hypothetical protein